MYLIFKNDCVGSIFNPESYVVLYLRIEVEIATYYFHIWKADGDGRSRVEGMISHSYNSVTKMGNQVNRIIAS